MELEVSGDDACGGNNEVWKNFLYWQMLSVLLWYGPYLLGITKLPDLFSEKTLYFDDGLWMYLVSEKVEEYCLKLDFLSHGTSFLVNLCDSQMGIFCQFL